MDLPPDIADLAIALEARSSMCNVARRWSVQVSRDLFGWVVIERSWGRIGTRGQRRRDAFAKDAEARRFVRKMLVRRAGAEARIGASYQPVLI